MAIQRTDLAEEFVAQFASVPLVAECVFLRPKCLRGVIEKEVCDVLIAHRHQAMILQLKCQGRGQPRTGVAARQWVGKKAEEGARQVKGAINTLRQRDVSCPHARRSSVRFQTGEVEPVHGIVLVESIGGLVTLTNRAELVHAGVVISYFTVNDFLNLVTELRAFPELLLYLRDRAGLPDVTRQAVGAERLIYEQYLWNEGGFAGCTNLDDMARISAERAAATTDLIAAKRSADEQARFVETMADQLATRLVGYENGLSPDIVAQFDPVDHRSHYLTLQAELCDLSLLERRALGKLHSDVVARLRADTTREALFHRAYVDHSRDRLYIIAASQGFDRQQAISAASRILTAGLAFFGKERGMIVVDRIGDTLEFSMIHGFQQHADYRDLGIELFGPVPVTRYVGSVSADFNADHRTDENP